jgi:tetratricopeptide (TPR) repeat protein
MDGSSEAVQLALKALPLGAQLPFNELVQHVQTLEDYECWKPCVDLLTNWTSVHTEQLSTRAKMAKICLYHLPRRADAARIVSELAATRDISFEKLERLILTQVIEPDDQHGLVFILENIWQSLTEQKDRVKCLERICLLYEKKIHDEDKLFEYNTKLLKVDPPNSRALRYFKVISAQSGDWPAVENYLARLVSSATHPKDVYRIAQELAAVQLYQLDKPSESLATVRKFCTESHLDTTTIEYDAYHRLGDWRGCSAVLRKLLEIANSNVERSIVNLKIAITEEASGNVGEAFQRYLEAFELNCQNIEAIERLIQLLIKKRDWQAVRTYVARMLPLVTVPELKFRLQEGLERVESILT